MLEHWIDSDLYARQGKAANNFKATLPPPQSDLAQQILKDPYIFDFLTLHADALERDLEDGLTGHITGQLPTVQQIEAELSSTRPKNPPQPSRKKGCKA